MLKEGKVGMGFWNLVFIYNAVIPRRQNHQVLPIFRCQSMYSKERKAMSRHHCYNGQSDVCWDTLGKGLGQGSEYEMGRAQGCRLKTFPRQQLERANTDVDEHSMGGDLDP